MLTRREKLKDEINDLADNFLEKQQELYDLNALYNSGKIEDCPDCKGTGVITGAEDDYLGICQKCWKNGYILKENL